MRWRVSGSERQRREVEDFVDFLRERTTARKRATGKEPLDFPVDDSGPWPEGLSLHRQDI
ncbi:hypothetical protein JCM17961_50850 [Endothiovibrio diazotrophicus]